MHDVKTAWSYLAVSSEKQVDTLEYQVEWARSVAETHGWEITRQFRGRSSGAAGTRKLLEELLDELRNTPKGRRPHRVLMIRLDRTGRGLALEPLAALAEIYRLGVIVHTREDGDVTITRASDTLKPILRVLTGAMENEARRDKATYAHKRKRDAGLHAGHPPYGVTLQDGKPVPDEIRAPIVRRVFEMRAAGSGYERIAHAVGPTAPPKLRVDGSTRELGWHRTFVRTMLQCKTYKGVVIPEELWDRAQETKNADFKDRMTLKYPWPLTGVVKCTCGYGITGAASGGNCQRCKDGRRKHNHQRIRYYLCNNPIAHPGKRPHIRADTLEAQFVTLLQSLAAQPELIEEYRRRASVDEDTLRAQAKDVERDLHTIDTRRKAAWDMQADDLISADELRQRLTELRAEHDAASAKLEAMRRTLAIATTEATAQQDARRILSQAAEYWVQASPQDQKAIARLVADAIGGLSVSNDGKLLFFCDGSTGYICEQMNTYSASRAVARIERLLTRIPC